MNNFPSLGVNGERILLDTHYWISLQSDNQRAVPRKTLRAIERAAHGGNLVISIISVWEVGMLEAKGRIHFRMPCEQWVRGALDMPGLMVAPLTPERATDRPGPVKREYDRRRRLECPRAGGSHSLFGQPGQTQARDKKFDNIRRMG